MRVSSKNAMLVLGSSNLEKQFTMCQINFIQGGRMTSKRTQNVAQDGVVKVGIEPKKQNFKRRIHGKRFA